MAPGPDQTHTHEHSRARELALKLLYLLDMSEKNSADEQIDDLLQAESQSDAMRRFARALFEGVSGSIPSIDEKIQAAAHNWLVSRMPYLDRAILRMGTWELLNMQDIPPRVTISEAIELAKKYSTEKSGGFVNGVLDKVFQTHCPQKV